MSPRRSMAIVIAGLAACALIGGAPADRQPRLLFNTTASAPVGFYRVSPGHYEVGDLVAVSPPPSLAAWMAARRYLPANVPLLKVVAAAGGQLVCGRSEGLFVDGRWLARAKPRDHWGRPLPIYIGCSRLSAGEVLLVNSDALDSLDSRYFGPVPADGVVGKAQPIWTWTTRQ